MNFIKNNIFSITTAIVAVVALYQTHKQISISNKQFLFRERVDKIAIFRSLFDLYEENIKILEHSSFKEDEPIIADYYFEQLTNCGYLKDHTRLIVNLKDDSYRIPFLLKLEELKTISIKIKYLFRGKEGTIASEFIINYLNVLHELYKYEIVNDKMKNDDIPRKISATYKTLKKDYGEANYRKSLFDSLDKINSTYLLLKKRGTISKLERIIKL